MTTDGVGAPRVLMLSSPAEASGPLPKIVPEILSGLRDRGFAVEWLAWGGGGEGDTGAGRILARLGDAVAARRFLSQHPATSLVVHTAHDWRTVTRDLVLLTLCRGRARCVALVLHGSLPARVAAHPRSPFSMLTKVTLSTADAVAVLSSEESSAWSRLLPASHVVVVRNPVAAPASPATYRRSGSVRPRILFVGRLIAAKGCADLLAGFRIVRRSTDCELRIVGEGPERESLAQAVHDTGLDDSVHMTGNLTGGALEEEYAAAAALVLPSYSEGLPTVVLEAMVRGVPVITTRTGASSDYFTDSDDVLFVPAGDPEAIAAALGRLLGDARLRNRLTEAARVTVARFDRTAVASDYEGLLKTALQAAESRRKRP